MTTTTHPQSTEILAALPLRPRPALYVEDSTDGSGHLLILEASTDTPQGISDLLKRARFDKSETKPSRIKGLQEWYAGFRVMASMLPGHVIVAHRVNSMRRTDSPSSVREMTQKLAVYAEVIAAEGWMVATESGHLTVTARKDQP